MITQDTLKAHAAPLITDYSHWSGYVNGAKQIKAGVRGAICKAGEVWIRTAGQPAIEDKKHQWSIQEQKVSGLLSGDYYYWHPSIGASRQARHYFEISGHLLTDFPPVIDVEEFDGITNADEIARQLKAMLDATENLFKRRPIIYTRNGLWVNQIGKPGWGAEYFFWLAQYSNTMTTPDPSIRDNTIMWQFTDRLALPGLPVIDGNYWLKTEKELIDLTTNTSQPPTPPEPETKIKIICNFLRGRTRPIYSEQTTCVIFENGQILDLVNPGEIVEESGIPFVEVRIPERDCSVWISGNKAYTKLL